ncbi:MAG: M20/M25/M40 family metallo-hydrolase [Eubacteriaceae bacterium]|nr:M20/M25/M40 family metallo-hydrolase [Eubacteriaceae bacterium]
MEDIIFWLIKLIAFDTSCGGGDAEACRDFIMDELSRQSVSVYPFATEGSSRRAHHLLAEVRGDSPEAVMLHAHLDTADFGDELSWAAHPRSGLRRKGCILGRGALDCKGPLAVWMKLMCDAAKGRFPFTLKLLVTDLEEEGGEDGLGKLLSLHPEITDDVKLVIGEGGGYPFLFREKIFYTFQTGEREDARDSGSGDGYSREDIGRILLAGAKKGYYSMDILDYFSGYASITGRRMELEPLYLGMEDFFEKAPESRLYERFGEVFERALRKRVPRAALMPSITPGYSDNRFFRALGIPVAGFFPLDPSNSLSGTHGKNEYISEASLCLAYAVLSDVIKELTEHILM